jgi:hypothetical protein
MCHSCAHSSDSHSTYNLRLSQAKGTGVTARPLRGGGGKGKSDCELGGSDLKQTGRAMKMTVFCDVAPCSVSDVFTASITRAFPDDGRVSTSETSDIFHQTTRRNITEDCHLHTRRRENLKSHDGGT